MTKSLKKRYFFPEVGFPSKVHNLGFTSKIPKYSGIYVKLEHIFSCLSEVSRLLVSWLFIKCNARRMLCNENMILFVYTYFTRSLRLDFHLVTSVVFFFFLQKFRRQPEMNMKRTFIQYSTFTFIPPKHRIDS